MALRVTGQMVANQTMRNLNASMLRLDRYNQQLSTGKRIHMPSDDPAGTEISMRLRTTIVENEQYARNVEDAIAWLSATDASLDQVTKTLQRARSLVIYGAGDTVSDESRQAIAVEMGQLLEDLIQVGNMRHGERYLFAGENTLTEPFVAEMSPDGTRVVSIEYRGTTGDYSAVTDPMMRNSLGITKEIGPGMTMRVNVHGDSAILPAMNALMEARDRLEANDSDALSNDVLEQLDGAIDTLLTWRAEAGARVNRLELVRGRLQDIHTNLTKLLSEREDVDIAETIMNLTQEENVYRLALASGARIIQPTLMDFLR